ncbi:hypothetical protein [Ferrimonas pelagia]|uniref:hypothetical protein n=1 Tax=Ferrimonas pelagia TaxID=1177826 RepID=UPI0031EDF7C6
MSAIATGAEAREINRLLKATLPVQQIRTSNSLLPFSSRATAYRLTPKAVTPDYLTRILELEQQLQHRFGVKIQLEQRP